MSKAYKVIDRFSEDIDLKYDIRELNPELTDESDLPLHGAKLADGPKGCESAYQAGFSRPLTLAQPNSGHRLKAHIWTTIPLQGIQWLINEPL